LGLVLPMTPVWANPAWHLYVVRHLRRDALQRALGEAGIGSLIHYPIPPHRQKAYAGLGLPEGAFPIAERLASEVLSLPMGPNLSDEAIAGLIYVIRSFADSASSDQKQAH